MPDLMSAALFERNARALIAHRRRPPFAGQWMLPVASVGDDETAEEALRRHAQQQFGVDLGEESFVETVYLTDPDDQRQYVANIFRASMGTGPMRFNAEGDYDDARWLAAAELEQLWMPPDLRTPLVQILAHPEALHETDWSPVAEADAQAVPLAEGAAAVGAEQAPPRLEDGVTDEGGVTADAPDNRAGWNAIAAAYQADWYGDRDPGRVKWSWGVFEDDVRLLDDLHGKRAIVLGCGGGQDVVALERLGAVAVGIDASAEQLLYARKYAQRHGAVNASFVEGTVEDLFRFDDGSFETAVSIHVLGYVEHADRAIAEAARVLKPGGVLVIAVPHPFDSTLNDNPPHEVARPYWSGDIDWQWEFDGKATGQFRDYRRTMSQWFDMLTSAGFVVERLVEPYQGDVTGEDAREFLVARARLVPYVLIWKARKR